MYIFLDIDGVINRQCQWKKPYSLYEPCFPVLKKIVDQTKGKLILISTWKTGLAIRENTIQKAMVSDDNTEQINRLINLLMEYDMYLYGKTSNLLGRTRDREIERFVFCKYFLHKVAKSFCRLLHLHFVGNCKTPASPV